MMAQRDQRSPGPLNAERMIGMRVRARRIMLGLSQKNLADALGVTFQQIQKYERGENRISAYNIYRISRALDVNLEAIFEGIDADLNPIDV